MAEGKGQPAMSPARVLQILAGMMTDYDVVALNAQKFGDERFARWAEERREALNEAIKWGQAQSEQTKTGGAPVAGGRV